MKSSRITKKVKDTKDNMDKQSPLQEAIEFTNTVEISGDGKYLYITEIENDPKPNFTKGLLQ